MVSRTRHLAGAGVLALLVGAIGWVVFGGAFTGLRPFSEVVLAPGMSVAARTPLGPVTIRAGRGTERTYSGPGWSRRMRLVARRSRWYGSLGLYSGAIYAPSGPLVVEEGRVHLHSRLDALRWLTFMASNDSIVYTSDGLVCAVSNEIATGSHPRLVELWQLYVDGRRPRDLPLACDDAFRVEGGAIPDTASPRAAPGGGVPEMSGPRAAARHFGDPSLSPAPPPR